MLTPPASSDSADFPAQDVPVSLQAKELKSLIADHDALLDKRLGSLRALADGFDAPEHPQEFSVLHYKLTDMLVKLERRLEPSKPPPEDPYMASPHELKRNRRKPASAANESFRYDRSFDYDASERDQTINETYESLTSDRGANSPTEAVALLQTYLNSILNIIKPNLKTTFSEMLEATGDLVNVTPMNAVNANNMNELISSIESTIGAFTI